jgi:hypothetical protein
MKLNALRKEPWVRFDWTRRKLKQVQRWANRRLWKAVPFDDYDASAKSSDRDDREVDWLFDEPSPAPLSVSQHATPDAGAA